MIKYIFRTTYVATKENKMNPEGTTRVFYQGKRSVDIVAGYNVGIDETAVKLYGYSRKGDAVRAANRERLVLERIYSDRKIWDITIEVIEYDIPDSNSLFLNGGEVARFDIEDNLYYIVNFDAGYDFMTEVCREDFVKYVKDLAYVYIMNEYTTDDYRDFCKLCDI